MVANTSGFRGLTTDTGGGGAETRRKTEKVTVNPLQQPPELKAVKAKIRSKTHRNGGRTFNSTNPKYNRGKPNYLC